jgi:diadenosine tetraphosphate (Ap4A) HIT family hydrolase
VLLHRNAAVAWFILVPETEEQDLLSLPAALREAVMEECSRIAAFVREHFRCPKINFAAIGNVVPQLHLHVVGRRATDPCWPRPIWGNLDRAVAYAPETLTGVIRSLCAARDFWTTHQEEKSP